jgi:outer membrane protein TolC
MQREYNRITEQIDEQIQISRERLTLAGERYRSAQERYDLTQSSYRLTSERHTQGLISTNRMLEVETTLTESETLLESVRANYFKALADYLYASGSPQLEKGL